MLSKVINNKISWLEIYFQQQIFIWKQKMYFLTLDKIFILDNFSFVQDKKYFVRAEGKGKKIKFAQDKKFCLMPRPSARTKHFLSWTKLKLSKIKILSRVKKYIFCFQKSFKTKFPDWKSIFNNKYSFCMTFESKKCSF